MAGRWLAVAAIGLALAACERKAGAPAPPRVETAVELPTETSTIVAPVTADLAQFEAAINRRVPQQLWRIDRQEPKCIKAQQVKLLGRRAKVMPDIGCRIVGQVTRGRIRLAGDGDRLVLMLPVNATIAARDVGGVLKGKTATGAAVVRVVVTPSVDRNWRPHAKVDIAYDWTEPPGIDFLGRRIRFVSRADAKLKGVIAELEQTLPQELSKLRTQETLAGLWRQGFTVIELNHDKPPAWMRVTPQRLGFGGYRVADGKIEMMLQAEALTETFVGARPADPTPTPLPPPSRQVGPRGLRFFVPVIADYAQLEPVVHRALVRRAAKGIRLRTIGPVDVQVGKVTVYATEGGRLAVGIQAEVKARTHPTLTATRGEVWLTGIPYNDDDSQVVKVRDLHIATQTDRRAADLLIEFALDPQVLEDIRSALTHDFTDDYQRVLTAARKAVAERRVGDFLLSADIGEVGNGRLEATGQGLFLPVAANGTATIRYAPPPRR